MPSCYWLLSSVVGSLMTLDYWSHTNNNEGRKSSFLNREKKYVFYILIKPPKREPFKLIKFLSND